MMWHTQAPEKDPFVQLYNYEILISSEYAVQMSVRLSVRPFVCIEQLGSHWTDFHEILYISKEV